MMDMYDPVDWKNLGVWWENHGLPDDWVHVTSIIGGFSYEWAEFHAFYSPSERKYFWAGGVGCSCNNWADELHGGVAAFQVGGKAALGRAIKSFGETPNTFVTERLTATKELAKFRPARVKK